MVTEFEQTLIPRKSKCHCGISVRQEAYGCHLINGFYGLGEFHSWSQNSFCDYFPSSRMETWNRNIQHLEPLEQKSEQNPSKKEMNNNKKEYKSIKQIKQQTKPQKQNYFVNSKSDKPFSGKK